MDSAKPKSNGGHDRFFALWPVYFHQNNNLGTENPEKFRAILPLYAFSRSPKRDSTSVIWPLFTWIDDREKKYHEWEGPWPIVVIARGEGKTTTRVWPLFSRAHNARAESEYYLWPLYKIRPVSFRFAGPGAHPHFVLSVLGRDRKEHRDRGGTAARWISGPCSPGTANLTAPAGCKFSRWLNRRCPTTGASSATGRRLWSVVAVGKQSAARERRASRCSGIYTAATRRPAAKKCSLLFGLFQYQSDLKTKKMRLFYIPVLQWHAAAGSPGEMIYV